MEKDFCLKNIFFNFEREKEEERESERERARGRYDGVRSSTVVMLTGWTISDLHMHAMYFDGGRMG